MLRSRSLPLCCAVAVAVGFGLPAAASALSIDFEGLDHGDIFAAPDAATPEYELSVDENFSDDDLGVIFDTNALGTRDPDLEFGGAWASGNIPDRNLGNVLVLQENDRTCDLGLLVCDEPDDSRSGGTFSLMLEQDFLAFAFTLVDIDLDEGEQAGSIRFLFDDGLSATEVARFGFDEFTGVSFGNRSANRIELGDLPVYNRVEIELTSSGAIDELELTPVPEPTSAALVALGLIGLARRRRAARRV